MLTKGISINYVTGYFYAYDSGRGFILSYGVMGLGWEEVFISVTIAYNISESL